MFKSLRKVRHVAKHFALQLIVLTILCANTLAEPAQDALAEKVRIVEIDDADCIVHGGKLVSVELVDTTMTLDVWVDRWFMDVQTADHTKQHLSARTPVAALGCSMTGAGPQHWTIHSIKQH